ncbi:ABC transporter permease [Priestia filamentosa]|uniref:ABC transporter permease n=2 Tax=Priestia filamentosa TaxID=1402861 RepID=UPI001FB30BE7|nr:ABC transporter permease [Priestia filamentosa]UOE59149.1 ABC transporter permease [Priestia filamentosa]
MKTMFSLAKKMLTSRKNRTILSIIGISIGFTLLVSSHILMNTLEKNNEDIVKQKYGDYDVIVGYQTSSKFLDEDKVDKINTMKDVQKTTSFLYPYIGDDNNYKREMELHPMYVGLRDDSLAKEHQFTKLSSGQLPKANEVVIPYSVAKIKNLHIGSKITFPFPPNKDRTVRVSGILQKDEHLHSVVLFSYNWLSKVTSQEGHTTTLMIKLNDWTKKEKVIQNIKGIDPKFFIDRQFEMDQEREQLGGLKPVVQGLDIAVLIGSALLLVSTLQMSAQEKKQEFATLRLLGARRKQLVLLIMFESIILSTLSAIMGLLLGIGISFILKGLIAKLSGVLIQMIYIDWIFLLYTVGIGIFITIIASMIPAILASKLPPIQAYRQSFDTGYKKKLFFPIISIVLLLSSLLLSGYNYIKFHNTNIYIVSAFVIFISIVLSVPFFLRGTIKALSLIVKPFLKQYGLLAGRNAVRQMRRSTQIAGIIMLGVIISIVGIGVLSVVKETTKKNLMDQYPLDHVIDSNSSYNEQGLPLAFYNGIEEIKGIQSVPVYKEALVFTQNLNQSTIRKNVNIALADVNGRKEFMSGLQGVDFDKLNDVLPLKVTKGTLDFNQLDKGGVVLTEYGAKTLGYKLGETIEVISDNQLRSKNGSLQYKNKNSVEKFVNLKIIAIIEDSPIEEGQDMGFYTSPKFMKEQFNIDSISQVYYKITDTSLKDHIEKNVEILVGNQSSSKIIVYDRQAELQMLYSQFNQRVALLFASVTLIWLLAMIGLMNNMASSLRERSREFATIRALGSKTRYVIQLALIEGTLVTFSGGVLGIIFGSILLNQLLLALDAKSIVFPWQITLVYLVIAPLMGVIATVVPAMYVSKKDILKDLSS